MGAPHLSAGATGATVLRARLRPRGDSVARGRRAARVSSTFAPTPRRRGRGPRACSPGRAARVRRGSSDAGSGDESDSAIARAKIDVNSSCPWCPPPASDGQRRRPRRRVRPPLYPMKSTHQVCFSSASRGFLIRTGVRTAPAAPPTEPPISHGQRASGGGAASSATDAVALARHRRRRRVGCPRHQTPDTRDAMRRSPLPVESRRFAPGRLFPRNSNETGCRSR